MTANAASDRWAGRDDLRVVGDIVALRLPPDSGEADRAANVRKLLDVCADLNYAVSTYTHRLLMYAGRRPVLGDLCEETAALQDALEAFARQVGSMADAYRTAVPTSLPKSNA